MKEIKVSYWRFDAALDMLITRALVEAGLTRYDQINDKRTHKRTLFFTYKQGEDEGV